MRKFSFKNLIPVAQAPRSIASLLALIFILLLIYFLRSGQTELNSTEIRHATDNSACVKSEVSMRLDSGRPLRQWDINSIENECQRQLEKNELIMNQKRGLE